MVDGDANNGGNVEEYKCDVCNESPAMTYNEQQGAVCNDCRLPDADDVPTWKASEVITVDNKWCGCYGCYVETGCRN